MRLTALVFLIALSPRAAEAGWFRNVCDLSLVAPDPYQFQDVSEVYLERELERLKIKLVWKKATTEDLQYIDIIEAELNGRRMREGSDG